MAKGKIEIRELTHDHVSKHTEQAYQPHRGEHYILVIVIEGAVTFRIDFNEVLIVAPTVLVIFPDQVHQLVAINDVRGWSINFDPFLITDDTKLQLENGLRSVRAGQFTQTFFNQAVSLIELIKEIHLENDDFKARTSYNLLTTILSLILENAPSHPSIFPATESRGDMISREFRELVSSQFKCWKQPAQYANALAISVPHLNDTIRKLTGSSVSAHIQNRSLTEAKRLLYFTSLSVKEIGLELGYLDSSYFNKFFKKLVGTTPSDFRKSWSVHESKSIH